uniref:Uncharacterized protein n=1 Tax=Cacopsylla melanoneura TaxID=428564 RepID=A0A8D8UR41_9HEMI
MFKILQFLFALSLLNCALAIWDWGSCPSIESSDFKHDSFAGRTWYEYKRSGVPEWEKGTTCNKLYYNGPFSPKQSKMIFSKPDGFNGLAELFIKENKKTAGRNDGTMTWELSSEVQDSFEVNVRVLATDYYSYFLLWSCYDYGWYHEEWATIWTGFKGGNSAIDEKIKPALQMIDPEHKFKAVNQTNCHDYM